MEDGTSLSSGTIDYIILIESDVKVNFVALNKVRLRFNKGFIIVMEDNVLKLTAKLGRKWLTTVILTYLGVEIPDFGDTVLYPFWFVTVAILLSTETG